MIEEFLKSKGLTKEDVFYNMSNIYNPKVDVLELMEAYAKHLIESIPKYGFIDNDGYLYKDQDPHGADMSGKIRIRPTGQQLLNKTNN